MAVLVFANNACSRARMIDSRRSEIYHILMQLAVFPADSFKRLVGWALT